MTLIDMAPTLPGTSEDPQNMNVSRGDEVVLLAALLSVVMFDEGFAERFPILVVEWVAVPLILDAT